MGAWGAGAFENDTALDWTYDLEKSSDHKFLLETLGAGLALCESGEEIDADTACLVLAAAEVLGALNGNEGGNIPDNVRNWAAGKERVSASVMANASLAVKKVREKSELKDLWEEGDGGEEWFAEVDALLQRLR